MSEIDLSDELCYDNETDTYMELKPDGTLVRWKNLYRINGDYIISDKGDVCHNGIQLAKRKGDREGHLALSYVNGGKKKYSYIHRLEKEAFDPKPDSHNLLVRHLNDIPYDNDLDNLAWGTPKDNHKDCVINGRSYSLTDEDREKGFKKVRKPVIVTELSTGKESHYISLNEACRQLDVQQANASKVIAGTRRHTKGYSFEYEKGAIND